MNRSRRNRKKRQERSEKTKSSVSERHSEPRSAADRLLLDRAGDILPGKALLLLVSGTAVARHLVRARPDVTWSIHTFEHFYVSATVKAIEEDEELADVDLQLFCTPDLPEGPFETVVMAADSRGSAELTRDLLQSAANRLKDGGRLVVSTKNARDHWLHERLRETWGRTSVHRSRSGICYVARKPEQPARQKQFDCEFAFRDGERLIRCCSRPGVFSHRRVDGGARALIRSLERLTQDTARRPPQRIIDMGCGSGAVATAAALRFPNATVVGVDSHVRAVQSTERTAALNDADNVSVLLSSAGVPEEAGQFDLFLCNPPYYSDYRISEIFLQSAADCLRPGGRIHLVTKLRDWHENRMIEFFANADVHEIGEYVVIASRR